MGEPEEVTLYLGELPPDLGIEYEFSRQSYDPFPDRNWDWDTTLIITKK